MRTFIFRNQIFNDVHSTVSFAAHMNTRYFLVKMFIFIVIVFLIISYTNKSIASTRVIIQKNNSTVFDIMRRDLYGLRTGLRTFWKYLSTTATRRFIRTC